MIRHACNTAVLKPVSKGENYYPGLRAPAPKDYALKLVKMLRPLVQQHFGLSTQILSTARCAFSLATTKPQDLTLAQRLPHFDSVEEGQIASVHFLCGEQYGGTAFYRHKCTGFETITTGRSPRYLDALNGNLKEYGKPGAQYMCTGDSIFDQTAHIEAKMDRLLIFKSTMLHTGMVNPDAGLSADPAKGRITANLFALFDQTNAPRLD